MSSFLKLATDLEQKSKVQQHDTEQMLKAAFSAHEQSVSEALSLSERTISAAIDDHNSRLSESLRGHREAMESALQTNRNSVVRMTGRTWLTITMVTVLLTGTSGAVLWWQSSLIAANLADIAQQRDTLSKLNAKTWGIQLHEDTNGRFLILPAGMKDETGWTFDNGKKNAVKLVKE